MYVNIYTLRVGGFTSITTIPGKKGPTVGCVKTVGTNDMSCSIAHLGIQGFGQINEAEISETSYYYLYIYQEGSTQNVWVAKQLDY